MRAIWQGLVLLAVAVALSAECFAAENTALVAFADAFKTGDVATTHGLMTDELRNDLTAERLMQLRQELLDGADEFRDVEVTRGRYFVGSVRLVGFQAKTRHKKHVVRLQKMRTVNSPASTSRSTITRARHRRRIGASEHCRRGMRQRPVRLRWSP